MKVAAIQHDIAWKDATGTCDALRRRIANAAAGGAEMVVLAEMFATGYTVDPAEIAESEGGPIQQFMQQQASEHSIWLLGSVAVWSTTPGRAINRLIAQGPRGERFHYDKRHPFSYAGEHLHYQPGDSLETLEIGGLRVTPLVCYDLRFADDFWERGPGTDLFVVVANWPITRRTHWMTLLRARAIENQAYVIGVNRVGSADGLSYSGDSAIIDPLGQILGSAEVAEATLQAEVTSETVAQVRAAFPFLQDRR